MRAYVFLAFLSTLSLFNAARLEGANTLAFGPRQVISTFQTGPLSVLAADLDEDGDLDVLSASFYDGTIAWYENKGGSFDGTPIVISTAAAGARSVYAADLDGDGDLDVLSASELDNKIAWYENKDGTFDGTQNNISVTANGACSVYAVDLNRDGDLDVLSASSLDNEITCYHNTDGFGSFGPSTIISAVVIGAASVHAADLDGDGAPEVLSASRDDDTIAWYESWMGGTMFGAPMVISDNANGANSVHTVDLDNDGDLDVLSASFDDDKIAWYENKGGTFDRTQNVISTAADGASSVYAADLDGDGDLDVLSASSWDNKIAWYENTDGLGSFGPQKVISVDAIGAASVYAADLDGDGDMDVLSASRNDDTIAWYEHTYPPVVEAGSDMAVLEGDCVVLDGSGSMDADGSITAWAWTQTQGTSVTLTGADKANPSFTAPEVGVGGDTLLFKLTVTDEQGVMASDSVTVTVNNASGGSGGSSGGSGGSSSGGGCAFNPSAGFGLEWLLLFAPLALARLRRFG